MQFQKLVIHMSRHFYISKDSFSPVFSESGTWTPELSRRQFVARSPNKSLSLISSDKFLTYVSSSSWPRIICFLYPELCCFCWQQLWFFWDRCEDCVWFCCCWCFWSTITEIWNRQVWTAFFCDSKMFIEDKSTSFFPRIHHNIQKFLFFSMERISIFLYLA